MKNPNGYGTVVKLSGNRRNPYAVRKTTGYNERGYPVYVNIGYAPTKEAGLIMLAEYNKDPWDVNTTKITLDELYEIWIKTKLSKQGESSANNLRSVYKRYFQPFAKMKYTDIKTYHMQSVIDTCGKGYGTQRHIKNLWHHLDLLATEMDISSKRYSELLTVESTPETNRQVFTEDEIQLLWNNQNEQWIDSLLIGLYTGFRISELLNIKVENIDLTERTIKAGVKTEAGRNRLVPIHSKIYPLVMNRISQSQSGYLFEVNGRHVNEREYRQNWKAIMQQTKMDHIPHEMRHTFRSRMDSAGANKVCIDRIMGHKSEGTGERIYTHKTIEELRTAIELVTN